MSSTERWAAAVFSIGALLTSSCGGEAPDAVERFGTQASALCRNLTGSVSPASPIPQNGTVHLTASATCDVGTGEFAFLWQTNSSPPSSAFIQNWSASASADWDTSGFNGSYNLYAYTRQAGNASQDAIKILGNYLIGRVCNSVSLSVSPGPAPNTSPTLGTPITLTAAAGCSYGGTPEYQFFYIPPGTANYVPIPQADVLSNGWGGSTATLDTSTLGAGRYSFYVRTRAAGNVSSLEASAYGPSSYYLGDVCPQVTQTLSPPSGALTGSSVTISASSLCLRTATPEYKFSYKAAGASSFTDIGGWGPSSTAIWDTSGLSAGPYVVQVFGRGRGNASTTEGYSQLPYTLSGFAIATNGASPQNIYYGGAERSNDGAKDLAAIFKKISGPTFTPQAMPGTGVPTQPGIYVASADVDAGRIPSAINQVATPAEPWPTGAGPTYREAFVIQQVGTQLWLVGKTALGVRHAVNRLLNELGYRYFFPGKHWEVIPSSPTLVYAGGTIADQPRTVMRAIAGDSWGDPRQNADRHDWRKRNGLSYDYLAPGAPIGDGKWHYMNTSLRIGMVQGAFGTEKENSAPAGNNPYNLIAQVNLGNVPGYPANWFNLPGHYGSDVQINPVWGHTTVEVTDAGVIDVFKKWVKGIEPIQNRGVHADFKLEPSDGTAGGVSRLATTVANIGNDADQLVYLANQVFADAEIANDSTTAPLYRHYASMLGGYYHSAPPTKPLVNPAMYVGIMPLNNHTFGSYTTDPDPSVPTPTARLMAAWHAQGASVGLWRNHSFHDMSLLNRPYDHTLGYQSCNYLNDSVALAKEFRDQGAAGSVVDIFESQDNFGPYGIGYYLTARLSWNPDQNFGDLRQDFFSKAFPLSWTAMKQYFDLFDPKNQPLIITDETMGKAVTLLEQASTLAAGATAELDRIRDLKAFIHHNALWWQIQRAPHCSGTVASPCPITSPQVAATKELVSWDYRNRFSYMTSYRSDQYIASSAYTQFGTAYFNDLPHPWLSEAELSANDIEAAFAQDRALFPDPTSPVQQSTWSGDPVAVSGFSGAVDIGAYEIGSSDHPISVAVYTNNGSVTLKVRSAAPSGSDVFPSDYPSDQLPSTRIWLTDVAGNQLYSTTGQKLSITWAPRSTAIREDKTFSNIPRPAGVPPGENFGVIAHVDASGYYSAVWVEPTTQVAWVNEMLTQSYLGSPHGHGYYFYVPKGLATIKFTWDRSIRTEGNDLISLALTPPEIYDDTDVLRTPAGGTNGFQSVGSITVNPQAGADHSGKLWRVVMGPATHASRLWFYNLPNYFSAFPQRMMVPRDLANTPADNLTIVP